MARTVARLFRELLVPPLRRRGAPPPDAADHGPYGDVALLWDCDGDFVQNPQLLWSPGPWVGPHRGLSAHMRRTADETGGFVYTDALVVLHDADFARSRRSFTKSWDAAAERELRACWQRLIDDLSLSPSVADRPLRTRIVAESDPLVGRPLGLVRGRFATIVSPNLHHGRGEHAEPLVDVFVDAGKGFAWAGTMWSDQLAFAIGNHPLDNARVDAAGEPMLWVVHRLPGQAGLHYKVAPEREERLRVESGRAHGGDTFRIVDRARSRTVIEVLLAAAAHAGKELRGAAEPQRLSLATALPGFIPEAFAPGTILPDDLDIATLGAVSVMPDALPSSVLHLVERETLLQRVHFRKQMSGYTLDLDRDGHLAPRAADPVARISVIEDRIKLRGLARDLTVDGRPCSDGPLPLDGPLHQLVWRGGETSLRSLRRAGDPRWPYLAAVSVPHRRHPLPPGEAWTIGRDRAGADIALPDRPTSDNIVWRGERGEVVSTHAGVVDRRAFRTDAICVASKAASIDLTARQPRLRNESANCALHVLRGGEVIRLGEGASTAIEDGDELLIGNVVFALEQPKAAPAPGPGDLGRRVRVGGVPGPQVLVNPHRTVGAILGLSPAAERAPVTQIGPRPSAPPRAVPAVPAPAPPAAAVADLAALDSLPSISLDTDEALDADALRAEREPTIIVPRPTPRGLSLDRVATPRPHRAPFLRLPGFVPGRKP